ncbi:YpmS family protein [Salinibacillus aidingensis]
MFKSKNKWKTLFFGIAGINLLILIWLILLIFLPIAGETNPFTDKKEVDKGDAEFTISSTKENLNKLVNTYLDELSKHTDIEYSVNIEDSVQLIGTIKVFDQQVPLTARFDPIVQNNGDLMLRLHSISLGRLELPNKRVLDYVKDNYPMPEWVNVNPGDETIYAAITEMEMKSNFNIEVTSFNLKSNHLAFRIRVPNKAFDLSKAF